MSVGTVFSYDKTVFLSVEVKSVYLSVYYFSVVVDESKPS